MTTNDPTFSRNDAALETPPTIAATTDRGVHAPRKGYSPDTERQTILDSVHWDEV